LLVLDKLGIVHAGMNAEDKDILIVLVTAPNATEAAVICHESVKSRLAACATSIGSVRSTYWWEGKLAEDDEVLLMLKTTAAKFGDLQEMIRKLHSYKVPEIIAVPVVRGFTQYIEWVQKEVS
jgi:periplasmic divalent cation tolerance protein